MSTVTAATAKKNACDRICWAYSPSTSGLAASSTSITTTTRAADPIGPAEYSAPALALDAVARDALVLLGEALVNSGYVRARRAPGGRHQRARRTRALRRRGRHRPVRSRRDVSQGAPSTPRSAGSPRSSATTDGSASAMALRAPGSGHRLHPPTRCPSPARTRTARRWPTSSVWCPRELGLRRRVDRVGWNAVSRSSARA